MSDLNIAKITIEGNSFAVIVNPKNFSTGSRGFYGNSKAEFANGKRYQVSVQLVEIGSKPKKE